MFGLHYQSSRGKKESKLYLGQNREIGNVRMMGG